MADIRRSVRDSVDSVNGNFSSFADAVDSMLYHFHSAMAADDSENDAHYSLIHWLDIEWDCYRNSPRIDAVRVSMVNNQLMPDHNFHYLVPLDWKVQAKLLERYFLSGFFCVYFGIIPNER